MKKEDFKYIGVALVLIVAFIGYNKFFKNTDSIILEKQGYYNDCYNIRENANSAIEMTEYINENNLIKGDNDITQDYKTSNCVKIESYKLENYFELSDYTIQHVEGKNNQSYQLSYQKVLEELNKKKNKTKLDEQIIKSLQYYTKENKNIYLIPAAVGVYQKNSTLIGPASTDKSGEYVLYINIDIAKNEIYEIIDKKETIKETKYIFDGISMQYVRVGE